MTALAFGRENKQDFVCLSLTGAALARPGSDCLFCPLSPQPLELNNPALEQRVSTRSPSLGLVTWQPSCSTLAGLARAGLRPSGCHLPQVSPCPAAAFFFFHLERRKYFLFQVLALVIARKSSPSPLVGGSG